MAVLIEDARGRGFKASVSTEHRLNTSSKVASRKYFVSRDQAQCYTWSSTYSATSGDEVLYIKNDDSNRDLYIDNISFFSEAGRATFTLYEVTGTASGTSITGSNLNLKSGNSADVTSLGNAAVTGITLGSVLDISASPDDTTTYVQFDGALILGFGDAIALSFAGSSGTVGVTAFGYFETVE